MADPTDTIIIECECGRRYMRTTVASDVTGSGFELCRCERKLGEWSGLLRYEYEPEIDGD
jgi:hypothetical protein